MSDGELATAAAALTTRLGDLTGALRAQGSRVGVGELIHAHRALSAIDPQTVLSAAEGMERVRTNVAA